ncbi:MAG: single-stranded DNA-binding protein [Paenalcaligenes sp.]
MAQLIGLARIGRDAVIRYTQNGDAVASLSLAFSYGQRGQDGKRPTQWVDGSLWGKRAENLAPHLLKGTMILVTLDDAHIETYQARDQTIGHKIVGRISALEFVSSPSSSGQSQAPAPTQTHQPSRQQPAANPYQAPVDNLADMDDDIPF